MHAAFGLAAAEKVERVWLFLPWGRTTWTYRPTSWPFSFDFMMRSSPRRLRGWPGLIRFLCKDVRQREKCVQYANHVAGKRFGAIPSSRIRHALKKGRKYSGKW